VSCGVVVVEERDARGSSVRRSRRTGTLVHATPCGGSAGGVALDLVGEAGTETYLFHKGSCRLFGSFVHQGKLTVCTTGMRHQQIMMSEADPALLTELRATLLGERNTAGGGGSRSRTGNARTSADTTNKTAAARCNRATGPTSAASSSRRRVSTRPPAATGAAATARRGAAVAAPGGALAPRSVNAGRGSSSLSSTRDGGRGAGVGPRACNSKGGQRGAGNADVYCGGHASTRPGAGRGGDASPARKSTRKVSPKKGAEERRRGGAQRELALSEDQQRAVDLVVEGRSVFFT
ncbi:unnamed protein product, partial [Scytosiphon promiscuus]